jgi:hypothetical protein
MMDNEIVIVGENMMMGRKWFLNLYSKNHFHEQCYVIQEILLWNDYHPPPTQLLLTTLYIYFIENWGALKINNY